jgi:hypothetical protein
VCISRLQSLRAPMPIRHAIGRSSGEPHAHGRPFGAARSSFFLFTLTQRKSAMARFGTLLPALALAAATFVSLVAGGCSGKSNGAGPSAVAFL